MQPNRLHFPLALTLLAALGITICSDDNDNDTLSSTAKTFSSIDFTESALPTTNADMVRNYVTSKAIVSYSDGSKSEFPLSYHTLFTTTDRVGKNANEAGRLYDVNMNPLLDLNGDPIVVETPDSNSLLNVDGKVYLVTHYEYDNILADGSSVEKMTNWYTRMPMGMTLTNVSQATDGKLTATDQKPIDFSSVNGTWIPCAGSQTPWNTHLGSEEDYDLYFVKADGTYDKLTVAGLKALTEKYFNSAKQANPYHYGYITEVEVKKDSGYAVKKHYNIGHASWEMALVMPDQRTLYFGDDGTNTVMAMFVADKAADLSSGSLYAAKWNQTSGENGGAANVTWIKLGSGNYAEAKSLIDSGIKFWDIFDLTTPEITADWAAQGYKAIRAGQATTEYLRLKVGKEQAAMYFETRRYAAYLGATTEFNKMEGVAVNRKDKKLYTAMSYIDKGMKVDSTGPVDHIQVPKLNAGGVYEATLGSGQKDQNGALINSDWVSTTLAIPTALRGEDIAADAQGNTASLNKIANPDNIFFAEKMRTLFIGEDSGLHGNNMLWAYNVDTKKLTRLMTLATGAESTGLQVVENLNGHTYIMSNAQHQGDWLSTMPKQLSAVLEAEAKTQFGVNSKNVPNFYLQGRVGYVGGIPGL
jgi:Predicted phosphatase